jgi:hypothetical protein
MQAGENIGTKQETTELRILGDKENLNALVSMSTLIFHLGQEKVFTEMQKNYTFCTCSKFVHLPMKTETA